MQILVKKFQYFEQPAAGFCDGKCTKAWGDSCRPRRPNGEFLPDDRLGLAPVDPGTTEGVDSKPRDYSDPHRINRWCVRECERFVFFPLEDGAVELPEILKWT